MWKKTTLQPRRRGILSARIGIVQYILLPRDWGSAPEWFRLISSRRDSISLAQCTCSFGRRFQSWFQEILALRHGQTCHLWLLDTIKFLLLRHQKLRVVLQRGLRCIVTNVVNLLHLFFPIAFTDLLDLTCLVLTTQQMQPRRPPHYSPPMMNLSSITHLHQIEILRLLFQAMQGMIPAGLLVLY